MQKIWPDLFSKNLFSRPNLKLKSPSIAFKSHNTLDHSRLGLENKFLENKSGQIFFAFDKFTLFR